LLKDNTAAARVPLDRDRILDAAFAVADAGGIDAVTMRSLAGALGVHFSSLYTHVASKEAILDGMIERLIAEADMPVDFVDWREWVRSFAVALRGMAGTHPGGFEVFLRRSAAGPLATSHSEAALAAFRRAGFAPRTAQEAVSGTALALLGLALNECRRGPMVAPDRGHVSPERFPLVAEALAAPDDTAGRWGLIVESLIAGLEREESGRR